MKKWILLSIGLLILLCVGLFIVSSVLSRIDDDHQKTIIALVLDNKLEEASSLLSKWYRKNDPTYSKYMAAIKAAEEINYNDEVKVVDVSFKDAGNGYATLSGATKNMGNKTAKSVTLEIEFYNNNTQKSIEDEIDLEETLSPGATKAFKKSYRIKPGYERVKVSIFEVTLE